MKQDAPTVFISYSHDNKEHKEWVHGLARRLVANGVHVLLDQWDLGLGVDLASFMEKGAEAKRVLAICTPSYVEKANGRRGGVGYEKAILSAQLAHDPSSARVIPVVRAGVAHPLVPTFLMSVMYIDFRNDSAYEAKYEELLRDIHGQKATVRPPLGPNPFSAGKPRAPQLSSSPDRYVAPGPFGNVTFDYSNNNGRFTLGAGDMTFETAWSRAGKTSIHAYSDPPSIRAVSLAAGIAELDQIGDASAYDNSSRVRTPHLGEIVIWENTAGYYLATKVVAIDVRTDGGGQDLVTIEYRIAPMKSASFLSDSCRGCYPGATRPLKRTKTKTPRLG